MQYIRGVIMNIEPLLNRLDKVRKTGHDKWTACCPAHDDRTPSLAIKHVDGRILLHCFSGCSVDSVLSALGLGFIDLFDEKLPLTCTEKISRRDRLDPLDALRAMDYEASIIMLAAEDILNGLALSQPEVARVRLAAERIKSARWAVENRKHDR